LKKTLCIIAVLAHGAGSANACDRIGEPPCASQPPTTITTFGNGPIINPPGRPVTTALPGNGLIIDPPDRPVTTVQPFSNSAIIKSTGQQTRICRSFGNNSVICH
jgi:hypothetical protein